MAKFYNFADALHKCRTAAYSGPISDEVKYGLIAEKLYDLGTQDGRKFDFCFGIEFPNEVCFIDSETGEICYEFLYSEDFGLMDVNDIE